MIPRRSLLLAAAAVPFAAAMGAEESFASLERWSGGKLGVAVLDTETGRRMAHRANERFLMCSTFKTLAAAAVFARADRGAENLSRFVRYSEADLLPYAPVTRAHVGEGGMALGALCDAAVEWSDNTAANLILASLGGPQAVTRIARLLGDPVTRLDRNEPSLNLAEPGGVRDTTTPQAMLADLHKLAFGTVLSAGLRERLVAALRRCRTADGLIPAGIPADWTSANKTGSGRTEKNDVAILWPPRRKPILVAAYFACPEATPDKTRNAVLAGVGRIVSRPA